MLHACSRRYFEGEGEEERDREGICKCVRLLENMRLDAVPQWFEREKDEVEREGRG